MQRVNSVTENLLCRIQSCFLLTGFGCRYRGSTFKKTCLDNGIWVFVVLERCLPVIGTCLPITKVISVMLVA
jgi:hypothetical protein